MNYVLRSVKTPNCETPTNLTVYKCSAQAQTYECINYPHILMLFSLVMLYTAKRIYLNQACSGFELESPGPFQDLKQKGW
jgi:hypothetical protein